MLLSMDQLEFCRSLAGEALLAAPLPDEPLAALTALRKVCPSDQAAAVMEVRNVRRRAARTGKPPAAIAGRMLGVDTLLQQASSLRLATYVGRRLAPIAGNRSTLDLCCGLGVNAIGLAMAGANVIGYDRSAPAVFCASHNASIAGVGGQCRFAAADVTQLSLEADAVIHIDPDRRPTGRRTVSLDDSSPAEPFLRTLPAATRAGVIKLSPALPTSALADWPGVQLEHLSENGICKQLLCWWGADLGAAAKATIVFGDPAGPESISLPAGQAPAAAIAEPGQWLIEPDAAVIAAGGTDDLAAWATEQGVPAWRIAWGLDWLFADEPIDTPLATCFHILRTAPGRQRDVAAAVAELKGGIVEIKPRGLKLDTDALQKRLRGKGERALSILWCKLGSREQAFIAERRVVV